MKLPRLKKGREIRKVIHSDERWRIRRRLRRRGGWRNYYSRRGGVLVGAAERSGIALNGRNKSKKQRETSDNVAIHGYSPISKLRGRAF
jgi:hypothetical protein